MKLEICSPKYEAGKLVGYFLRKIPENGEWSGQYVELAIYNELTGQNVASEIPVDGILSREEKKIETEVNQEVKQEAKRRGRPPRA